MRTLTCSYSLSCSVSFCICLSIFVSICISFSLSIFLCFSYLSLSLYMQPFLLPDKPLVSCFVVAILLLVVVAHAISKFLALISDSFRLPSPPLLHSIFLCICGANGRRRQSLTHLTYVQSFSFSLFIYLALSISISNSLSISFSISLSISFSPSLSLCLYSPSPAIPSRYPFPLAPSLSLAHN